MAKARRICHFLLRSVALVATLSAVIIIEATSHEAKYTHSPFYVCFVIANSVATVYGFLVLLIPAQSLLWQPVVALDLVMTMLLISSFCAILPLAIGHVGMKGNAFWQPIGALIAGSIAVIIYIIFLLYSIHTAVNPLLLKKRLNNCCESVSHNTENSFG